MTEVPGHPQYRWLKVGEPLTRNALWYDEDPAGTTVALQPTRLYTMDRSALAECHRGRDHDWPSDAHGLCGIVVPK